VPARNAGGLLYSPDVGGFVGHAWTEIWVDGKWVGLDGTLGLGGVGPTHVQFGSGADSFIKFSAFDPTRVKVEVVQVRRYPLPEVRPPAKMEQALPAVKSAAENPVGAAKLGVSAGAWVLTNVEGKSERVAKSRADAVAHHARGLGTSFEYALWPAQHSIEVDLLNARHYLERRVGPGVQVALKQQRGEATAAAYEFGWRLAILKFDVNSGRTTIDRKPRLVELTRLAKQAGWAEVVYKPLLDSVEDRGDLEEWCEKVQDLLEAIQKP
jgi:hypothetical protein